MSNNRIYYPHVAVGIAPQGSSSFTVIHGLQEFGMTANFNLEQVQEIGQFEIYEDVEGLPEVEFNLDKVLDGYPLIYHLSLVILLSNALENFELRKTGYRDHLVYPAKIVLL